MPPLDQTALPTNSTPVPRACLLVVISVAAYGLVWGALARSAGLTLLEVVLMSGLVFAGSAEFVALDLSITAPSSLSIGPPIIAAQIINLRYLLLTATTRPLYPAGKIGWSAALMLFVTDENWAISMLEIKRDSGTLAFLLERCVDLLLLDGHGRHSPCTGFGHQ
ncbi:MAG: AzlC family ABC transporter permease [Candidatus Devosia symbiotica]|nr:AzlC family ABC transporter permease [Candidatus Devosia symbiotica]